VDATDIFTGCVTDRSRKRDATDIVAGCDSDRVAGCATDRRK
jgi:hypothetical protein